jgi:chlorite dismutase
LAHWRGPVERVPADRHLQGRRREGSDLGEPVGDLGDDVGNGHPVVAPPQQDLDVAIGAADDAGKGAWAGCIFHVVSCYDTLGRGWPSLGRSAGEQAAGASYTGRMPAALEPSVGLAVVHLFFRAGRADRAAVVAAVEKAEADGVQVVPVAILGHKADLAVMALAPDVWRLRALQRDLVAAGLELADSYVSLTELSEYAAGVPDEMKQARLYPQLPPEGKPAWCFYPMSKRRNVDQNWYELPFDDRRDLMYEHGSSGRKFRGRVLQLITGSTGLDEYEWGVTLFAQRPDDLKEVVYTLRYDVASARYAEFGPFFTGMVAPLDEVLDATVGTS